MQLVVRALRLASAAGLVAAAMGCDGSFHSTEGGGGDPMELARAEFESKVQPILQSGCTACHAGVEPAFLRPVAFKDDGEASMFGAVMAWPNLVKAGAPADSRLVSYGTSDSHSGTELSAEQAEVVSAWIRMLPTDDGGDMGRQTAAFDPVEGAGSVDLSLLDPTLAGASLTYSADHLAAGLYLSGLIVHGGSAGVSLKHPLFQTVCDGVAAPDPVDSFYNHELNVPVAEMRTLGGGTVSLLDWRPGCLISIHFKALAPAIDDGGPGPGGGGCMDVPAFTAQAQAQLNTLCASCHAGGQAAAKNSFDLSNIANLGTAEQTQACGQTLGKINLPMAQMSILFQRVAPGQATGHPLTLNQAQYDGFVAAILAWVATEQ